MGLLLPVCFSHGVVTSCVFQSWGCYFLCVSVMGKAEGSVAREEWHGHVTALSVAPEFRRLGLAAKLMEMLEEISERSVHGAVPDHTTRGLKQTVGDLIWS